MNYRFHIERLEDYFSQENNFKNNIYIMSLNNSLLQYLQSKFLKQIKDFPYIITIIKITTYENHNVFWTYTDIIKIFNHIDDRTDIYSSNELTTFFYNIKDPFQLFPVENTQLIKDTLISVKDNNIFYIKDLLGSEHNILLPDFLKKYNIYTIYINGKYILLSSEEKLCKPLLEWESKLLLQEL